MVNILLSAVFKSNDFKKIVLVSAGRWGAQVSSLFVFLFSAAFISVEGFGIYSLIISCLIFSEVYARNCVENFLAANKGGASNGVGVVSVVYATILAIILNVVVSMLVGEFDLFVFLVVNAIVLFHWLSAYVRGILLNVMALKVLTSYSLVCSFSSAVVAVIMLVNGYGYKSLLCQQLTLWGGIGVLGLYFILKNEYLNLKTKYYYNNKFMLYSFKSFISTFLSVVSTRLDVFIVSTFFGVYEAGLYYFVQRIYQVLQDIVVGGVERYMVVKLGDQSNVFGYLKQILIGFFFFLVFVYLSVCFLGPYFLSLFFGEKWLGANEFLWFMGGGFVFSSLAVLCRAAFYSSQDLNFVIKSNLFELVVTAALMGAAFSSISYISAAFSLKYFLLFLFYFVCVKRNYSVVSA